MDYCTVGTCNKTRHAKGLCNTHYARLLRTGSATGSIARPSLTERFWAKVEKTDGCWWWTSGRRRDGYGVFTAEGASKAAHRVAYELTIGKIPEGLFIDHMCHKPLCVNPEHLRAVTPKQNSENRAGARKNSSSGIRGVTWDSKSKKWVASMMHLGKTYHLGRYQDIEEAAAAAAAKRLELFTHSDADKTAA